MGAAPSGEAAASSAAQGSPAGPERPGLASWASMADLALATRRMKVIPSLPAECQVEALRALWRNLRWVQAGTPLLRPSEPNDRMIVIVQGEAEAVFGGYDLAHIPLLPAGSFVGEAALVVPSSAGVADSSHLHLPHLAPERLRPLRCLRRRALLPGPLQAEVESFLRTSRGLKFKGWVRTTRESLVADLTRKEFLAAVARHDAGSASGLSELAHVHCNVWQNVKTFGERRELGAQDFAALRVVCEGPTRVSCAGFQRGAEVAWGALLADGPFGACAGPSRAAARAAPA
ncbi:unnamed protein product [Prorocentrum cordatum]|uniref:Cyclic nucleotide-binding domain-containing protein n=1 Tax=Prorocentrum cordatum TaxID=2364126 RepID=A0ABN9X8C9_9DINO|nr:unnamed protein product [Polarella glacialis]